MSSIDLPLAVLLIKLNITNKDDSIDDTIRGLLMKLDPPYGSLKPKQPDLLQIISYFKINTSPPNRVTEFNDLTKLLKLYQCLLAAENSSIYLTYLMKINQILINSIQDSDLWDNHSFRLKNINTRIIKCLFSIFIHELNIDIINFKLNLVLEFHKKSLLHFMDSKLIIDHDWIINIGKILFQLVNVNKAPVDLLPKLPQNEFVLKYWNILTAPPFSGWGVPKISLDDSLKNIPNESNSKLLKSFILLFNDYIVFTKKNNRESSLITSLLIMIMLCYKDDSLIRFYHRVSTLST